MRLYCPTYFYLFPQFSLNISRFEGKFMIPDVYGVYQFKVDCVHSGLTCLMSITPCDCCAMTSTRGSFALPIPTTLWPSA